MGRGLAYLGDVHKLRLQIFEIFDPSPLLMETSSLNSLHNIAPNWPHPLCANVVSERPLIKVHKRSKAGGGIEMPCLRKRHLWMAAKGILLTNKYGLFVNVHANVMADEKVSMPDR